jgi:NAD(P) transhydrogenase subunit beta
MNGLLSSEFADAVSKVCYLIAAVLFILSLKWLSAPDTARRGVWAGEIGMVLAIGGTLLLPEITHFTWILLTVFVGTAIGIPIAVLMPMTAVPQRTALAHQGRRPRPYRSRLDAAGAAHPARLARAS